MKVRVITVGKLSQKNLGKLYELYLKRLLVIKPIYVRLQAKDLSLVVIILLVVNASVSLSLKNTLLFANLISRPVQMELCQYVQTHKINLFARVELYFVQMSATTQ